MKNNLKLVLFCLIFTSLVIFSAIFLGSPVFAKNVTVDKNGAVENVTLYGGTVKDALLETNTVFAHNMEVSEALNQEVQDKQLIEVRYNKPLTIREDGAETHWFTTAITYSEALQENNIEIDSSSLTNHALTDEIPLAGATLEIQTMKTVKVRTQKAVKTYNTNASIVGDFLRENNILVDANDRMNVEEDSPVIGGMTIQILDVTERQLVQQEEYPLEVIKKEDATLPFDTNEVIQPGAKRIIEKTLRIKFTNGKVSAIKTVKTRVLVKGEPKIVRIGTGMPPVDPGSAQAYAQALMKNTYGWGAEEYNCLYALWMRESGWNYKAENSSSGAYGIPQSLPGDKMATAGSDWRTNPETQIQWGLLYIQGRYGSPCGAYAHSNKLGWY